jgi:hypothetical protein
MQTNLGQDLRMLDVETFEIEEINDIGIDAPAVIDEGEEAFAATSSSCSCSSCCSCSTSSCCSCSTSCS